jgi:hypothetical protein
LAVGDVPDHLERGQALGMTGDARQPRIDDQTRAVL